MSEKMDPQPPPVGGEEPRRTNWTTWILILAVGAMAAHTLLRPKGGLKPGRAAPKIKVRTAEAKPRQVALPVAGKPNVLVFWATWCPACVRHLGEFSRLAGKLGSKAVVVGLNQDERMPDARLRGWLKGRRLDPAFKMLRDTDHAAGRYRVSALPAIVLVGPDGTIAGTYFSGNAGEKLLVGLRKLSGKKR